MANTELRLTRSCLAHYLPSTAYYYDVVEGKTLGTGPAGVKYGKEG